jgi:IS5 family transposase
MKARSTSKHQRQLFNGDILEYINPKDPLLQLSKAIPWEVLEKEFSPLYSDIGRPAKEIRLMCGLLILKQLENLSDERLLTFWVRSPYFQAFCGETTFQWRAPCASSDISHFRRRIGEEGAEKIFGLSIKLHGEKALEKEVLFDTTVQEQNITFPTDSKLRAKVIVRCWKLAKEHGVKLRRSYKREVKVLVRGINFTRGVKKNQIVNKYGRRLKTVAGTLLRELMRKLPPSVLKEHEEQFSRYERAVNQSRKDKNKVYSLHQPQVLCIAKGKAHKKYEFGSKVCLGVTKKSGIIVAAKSFDKNLYDGDTLEDTIKQMERVLNHKPDLGICDKGFRGRKTVEGVKILTPENQGKRISEAEKKKNRKRNLRRSAIEPVIGHMKNDFRMARNFLKHTLGDTINALMAAAAFNFKKWMRTVGAFFCFAIFRLWTLLWSLNNTPAYAHGHKIGTF